MSSPGYSVTVVATEDDTTVESDGEIKILDVGEMAIYEYPLLNTSILVTCSKNCLVTQYSKYLYDGISFRTGLFMQNLLPEKDFTTLAIFTALDIHPISYVSLVVKGESPGEDLHLSGTSLGYLSWNPIHGYSTAELAIPHGVYELESVSGRPVAAYIYCHSSTDGAGGAGYGFLPMEAFRVTPTPTPTTEPPSVNVTIPEHIARVNGSAITKDGENMSPTCMMVSRNKCLKECHISFQKEGMFSQYLSATIINLT